MIKKFIWFAVIFGLVIFMAKSCFKAPVKQVIPPRPVQTGEVIRKDALDYIDAFGNLYALNNVDIKSQVTGQIKEIHFNEGQEVKTGDLLITIDPNPYEAELNKAKATLAQDTADLELKKVTLVRNTKLYEKELISKQDFDTYSTDVTAGEAKVKFDRAQIDAAQINYDYCFIKSPVDGLTGKRLVDLGNIVPANTGPTIVNIKTVHTLYIDFTIPETELDRVRAAFKEDKLKVNISPTDGQQEYSGELELLENAVDNKTGTVLLRAIVSNEDKALWAGQFVRVRLILGTEKDATLAPYLAVQMGQKGAYLFVATPDNKADLRMVTPGSRQGDYIVIKNKVVEPGEKVVTEGYLGLSPGVTVVDITGQNNKE